MREASGDAVVAESGDEMRGNTSLDVKEGSHTRQALVILLSSRTQ